MPWQGGESLGVGRCAFWGELGLWGFGQSLTGALQALWLLLWCLSMCM